MKNIKYAREIKVGVLALVCMLISSLLCWIIMDGM